MQNYFDKETLKRLKEKLPIEEYVSEYVDLSPRHGKMFGLCPFHQEVTPSFMVDLSSQSFHCFGCRCGGDIYTFIMKHDNLSFVDAVLKVAKLVGETVEPKEISETVAILKRFGKSNTRKPINHLILDKSIYDAFDVWDGEEWIEEGIPRDMLDKYEVRFDRKSNRIVYPVYDSNGNFINVKGRTKYKNWKQLKIPKYINYFKVGGMDYLQGLHLNKEYIHQAGEVIIFEGVKSCMKAESFGYHNVVSAETAALTLEQIELILTLRCNVVIAFDKDKRLSDYLNKDMKMLSRFVNLYYIEDRNGLLGAKEDKNSPVDKGKEVWDTLYQSRREVKCY